MLSQRSRLLAPTALAGALLAVSAFASSAPPGRSWAPAVVLTHPDVTAFSFASVLLDDMGRPTLVVGARRTNDPVPRWAVLAWRDTVWTDSIWSPWTAPGFVARIARFQGVPNALSIPGQPDLQGYFRLVLWGLGPAPAPPETVAVTTSQLSGYAYSTAASNARRWASRIEQRPNEDYQVRTYFSDQPGIWQEVARLGFDEVNCAITPLGDTSLLLVYTGFNGSRWAILDGTQWSDVKTFSHIAQGPTFVPKPGNAWWLVSTDGPAPQVDAWDGADWTHEATLQSLRDPDHAIQGLGWIEPSLETKARPAVAWQENWFVGVVWHTEAHVSWPTDSGWSPGYQVPNSDGMDVGPSVALDPDEDVWLVWLRSADAGGGHFWTHSYVSATAGAPRITPQGGGLRLEWDLSESAPGSWWAVLRDGGTGSFDLLARVRADAHTAMSWLDPAPPLPPSGPIRYRIRRESVDARYEWSSPVTSWDPQLVSAPGALPEGLWLRARGNPVGARTTLELHSPSPGEVEVVLEDARGRLVSTTPVRVRSEGAETVRLDWGSSPPGVYFVFARDRAGRISPVLKLVRLDDEGSL